MKWGCMKNDNKITALLKPIIKESIIDPAKVRLAAEYYYIENMTIRLIELLSSGEYENQLAEKIEYRNEKKDIYFTIKDAYFSDGTKITIHDVVNTIKRVILIGSPHSDPKNFIRGANTLKSLDQDIEGLKIIDFQTFRLGLNNPMKEIFYYLQLADYGVLHSDQYNKTLLKAEDWMKATSGPYHLNENLIFEANKTVLNFNKKMPKFVVPEYYEDNELLNKLKENKLHAGTIKFSDYVKIKDELKLFPDLTVFGGIGDGIVTLTLNIKSDRFKSVKTRQWIQKKILEGYKIKKDQESYMKKAYQYFLPGAKGYVDENQAKDILAGIDLNEIPKELENGINIRTLETMKSYVPVTFEKDIESVLGIPVKIIFDIPSKNYMEELGKRDFEAFMIASSMSYKVLAEALNLKYLSENPLWLDPSENIHKLLKKYQATGDLTQEEEIINKILKTMIIDSECVPLFYFANPKFFNNRILDMSKVHMEESLQFWRLRVKD